MPKGAIFLVATIADAFFFLLHVLKFIPLSHLQGFLTVSFGEKGFITVPYRGRQALLLVTGHQVHDSSRAFHIGVRGRGFSTA